MLRDILSKIGEGSYTSSSLAGSVGARPAELRAALDILVERGYVKLQREEQQCTGECRSCIGCTSCPTAAALRPVTIYTLTRKGMRIIQ